MPTNLHASGASSPTHTTYQVNVPVQGARSDSPDGLEPPQPQSQPDIQIPKITPISGSSPAELAIGLEGKYVDEFGNILGWDGIVLGRVDGDLPSMIGRPVTASGEILDLDSQVVGHVSENYCKPNLKPLGGGLQVDDEGNIYDGQGSVVGKLNSPVKGSMNNKDGGRQADKGQDVPKLAAAPRPDEIYLDVKSTFDGIQLVIKIPTVFNRDRGNRI